MDDSATIKPSAVLIPAFHLGGDVRIVLVERGPEGVHGGQVAFPGGKPESSDRSLLETALREAEEEIGLDRSKARVLAELDPVETRTTGFRVHPFLALVPAELEYSPQASEIASVFAASVCVLADPARRGVQILSFPMWKQPRSAEGIALENGLFVWGLTLRILDLVVPRIITGEWAELRCGG